MRLVKVRYILIIIIMIETFAYAYYMNQSNHWIFHLKLVP